MRVLLLFFVAVLSSCAVEKSTVRVDQNVDRALFSIEGDTTYTSEFWYAYNKNNSLPDSVSRQDDLKEYLDLYIKFKLKIAEAKSRGMDTTAQFRKEFNTYSAQLKKPYLTDKAQIDSLVLEAYDRLGTEIRASHLLIKLDNNATPDDTVKAYEQIKELRERALRGESFEDLIVNYSQDPSARMNKGDLGYFTAMQMVYPFENAAFTTDEDKISEVVRTQFGYHILKVKDRRPANGQVDASHIMVRFKGKTPEDSLNAKNKIFEIYDQLQGGVAWRDLVSQYSDDINSKNTGGRLRPFRVGQLPLPFQEAAFSLKEPGQISDPVLTPYGWHIIRLDKRQPIQPYEELQPNLEAQVNRGERARISQKALINRLKKENGFAPGEGHQKLLGFNYSPDSLNNSTISDSILFQISDEVYTYDEFINSLSNTKVVRVADAYEQWVNDQVMAYEEAHLEEKYFDYRMLLQEYRQGILLFQLMENEVWKKASEDTVGLREYYQTNLKNYMFKQRVQALVIRANSEETLKKVLQKINNNDEEVNFKEIEAEINKENPLGVTIKSGKLEVTELPELDSISIKEGEYEFKSGKRITFVRITDVISPEPKPFNDIRGLVIADYQKYLEDKWVENLKSKYGIKINQEAVDELYEFN